VSALLAAAASCYNTRRLGEAEHLCARILDKDPRHAGALHLAGLIALSAGNVSAAQDRLARAATYQPGPDVLADLAAALIANDNPDQAVQCCRRALEEAPQHPGALYNLGTAFNRMNDFDAALPALREAVRLQPDFLPARANLGQALRGVGDLEAARRELEAVLERDPSHANALFNLANVCHEAGDYARSDELFARALERAPGFAQIRHDYALALLSRGDYARGWDLYDARWESHRVHSRQDYPQAAWHGEPLSGRRLLAWGEQGLGDEIMFAGILPELIAEASSCTVVCERRLAGLFARSFPGARVVARGSEAQAMAQKEAFDYQAPTGSLARYRRRQLEDFPAHAGYLHADPARTREWRRRLDALGGGLKVGISWRGGSPGTRERLRSTALEDWLPVFRVSGTQFVSLQYTDCSAELAALRDGHGVELRHWQEAIDDYEETAALVCALDLVVSVTTALVHLAGALGRPTLALVPAIPGWRYLRAGERMPWYPSMRLLRQARVGDWSGAMARAAAALLERMKSGG